MSDYEKLKKQNEKLKQEIAQLKEQVKELEKIILRIKERLYECQTISNKNIPSFWKR